MCIKQVNKEKNEWILNCYDLVYLSITSILFGLLVKRLIMNVKQHHIRYIKHENLFIW